MRKPAYLNRRRLVAFLALALWSASLMLPVAQHGNDRWMGWLVLILGPLGVLTGQFGWFANLGFLASFGLSLGARPPTWLDLTAAVLTLAAAVDALFWRKLYYDSGSVPIQAFGPGYYLWLTSIVVMAGWMIWLWIQSRRLAGSAHPDQDKDFSPGQPGAA